MNGTFLSPDFLRFFEDCWIEEQLKILSNGKYVFLDNRQFGKPRKEFWRIISNSSWEKINFHFELRWNGGTPITEAKKINIRIHLESKFISAEQDEKIKGFFKQYGEINRNTIKVQDRYVIPDFSTEETAIETIQHIIDVLNSEEFQKWADIADEYLKANP